MVLQAKKKMGRHAKICDQNWKIAWFASEKYEFWDDMSKCVSKSRKLHSSTIEKRGFWDDMPQFVTKMDNRMVCK